MNKTFTVSLAVDGRIDVAVLAETPQEAFKQAEEAFKNADLSKLELIGVKPVNATDDETQTLTDY